jgi:molecular chaperone IbpA
MRTLDFSPLYRSTVGFDNLSSLMDTVSQWDKNQSGYPPYNIELVKDDGYRISMAVAGFIQDELGIQVEKQILTVTGVKPGDEKERNYLHRGIAARNFERRFRLADHVKVSGAKLENGLLHIDLQRELPEAMKPRTISIESGDSKLIDLGRNEAA